MSTPTPGASDAPTTPPASPAEANRPPASTRTGAWFHAAHFNWILNRRGEIVCLFGIATGRVRYEPEARWLYSLRLFLGPCKVEVLWRTYA